MTNDEIKFKHEDIENESKSKPIVKNSNENSIKVSNDDDEINNNLHIDKTTVDAIKIDEDESDDNIHIIRNPEVIERHIDQNDNQFQKESIQNNDDVSEIEQDSQNEIHEEFEMEGGEPVIITEFEIDPSMVNLSFQDQDDQNNESQKVQETINFINNINRQQNNIMDERRKIFETMKSRQDQNIAQNVFMTNLNNINSDPNRIDPNRLAFEAMLASRMMGMRASDQGMENSNDHVDMNQIRFVRYGVREEISPDFEIINFGNNVGLDNIVKVNRVSAEDLKRNLSGPHRLPDKLIEHVSMKEGQ